MIIKVNTNGRITLPKSIREGLKIEDNEKLSLNLENDKIILENIKK